MDAAGEGEEVNALIVLDLALGALVLAAAAVLFVLMIADEIHRWLP